jgi:hypothetical protein
LNNLIIGASGLALAGLFTAMYFRYKISGPNEYIVKTGLGINDV